MSEGILTEPTLKTPLYEAHRALKARLVDFAGWEMPIQYTSILEEHRAVRSAAGLFDVSHMGRFEVKGTEAKALLDYMLPADIGALTPGKAVYTILCNEKGGIMDDLIVYCLGEVDYLMVVNAANRLKDLAWLLRWQQGRFKVDIKDRTMETALLALQGPKAVAILAEQAGEPQVREIPSFSYRSLSIGGISALAARTGYTGEDGFELMAPAEHSITLWERILAQGVRPCALGARDTLRMEACLLLWGNDMDESVNPYEAGLGRFVHLDKDDFVGKAALEQAEEHVTRRLAGFDMIGRGIPRAGYPILKEGQKVGHVTSGGYAPTLDKAVALGYVPIELATIGTQVEIDIRGNVVAAKVARRPFYKRAVP